MYLLRTSSLENSLFSVASQIKQRPKGFPSSLAPSFVTILHFLSREAVAARLAELATEPCASSAPSLVPPLLRAAPTCFIAKEDGTPPQSPSQRDRQASAAAAAAGACVGAPGGLGGTGSSGPADAPSMQWDRCTSLVSEPSAPYPFKKGFVCSFSCELPILRGKPLLPPPRGLQQPQDQIPLFITPM